MYKCNFRYIYFVHFPSPQVIINLIMENIVHSTEEKQKRRQ